MDAERRAYVETMMKIAADFPDGAFLGFMQEKGISMEEVVEVSNRADRPTQDEEGRDG